MIRIARLDLRPRILRGPLNFRDKLYKTRKFKFKNKNKKKIKNKKQKGRLKIMRNDMM